MPDVEKASIDCERFGAQGITVHPRPDQRHIRYSDVRAIRPTVTTEFNIEGNPIPEFVSLVLEVVPDQVTLVPDAHDAITSDAGWDTIAHREFLTGICKVFKDKGIRTSIFIGPDPRMAEGAMLCGADRVVRELGLGLNAGHDLNLDNLRYFIKTIPWTDEVSIGHAIICDALYMGLEKTIQAYLSEIKFF